MSSDDPVAVSKPERWDVPFWKESLTDHSYRSVKQTDVISLMSAEPFMRLQPERFPHGLSPEELLKNDTRVRRFENGEVVFRQGDYGSSAFFILSGKVSVVLEGLSDEQLGRHRVKEQSLWDSFSQLWRNPKIPELRNYQPGQMNIGGLKVSQSDTRESETRIFIEDCASVVSSESSTTLDQGEFFGEIAAFTRTPRTASIIADGDAVLLEIRWQGLRDICRWSGAIKAYLDQLYRQRSLAIHLRATPMFRHLPNDALREIVQATEFQTHGSFDWDTSYRDIQKMPPAERLQYEPLIAKEGDYPNGVFLIRSGFARISEKYNNGERTTSYIGRGQVFGFEEVAHNHANPPIPFQQTLRGVGYLDLLFVPTSAIEEHVLNSPEASQAAASLAAPSRGDDPPEFNPTKATMDSDFLEFMVERRFINGTATMLIDMERCTRCDDCVKACATSHAGNPRFIRHGPVINNTMVANACMHCQDPVCMIGCPTGAIHRLSLKGEIVINDATCIGCATCANACPYDNIQVVPTRDAMGDFLLDSFTQQPIEKATKCDLCAEQNTGPACAYACPHDAMVRMDMSDQDAVTKWLNR